MENGLHKSNLNIIILEAIFCKVTNLTFNKLITLRLSFGTNFLSKMIYNMKILCLRLFINNILFVNVFMNFFSDNRSDKFENLYNDPNSLYETCIFDDLIFIS